MTGRDLVIALLAAMALATVAVVLWGCASPPTIWPEGLIAAQLVTPVPTPGELDDLLPQIELDDGARAVPMLAPPRICTMYPAPWPAPHVNGWPRWSCLCDPQKPADVRMECS